MERFKITALQIPLIKDKRDIRSTIKSHLKEKTDFVILPEMFCCPYDTKAFPAYAEKEGGETWQILSCLAKEEQVFLIAGSVPETDGDGRIYNTSYVFDRDGKKTARHRKMHLFDIDVKGGQCFRESDTLTAGDRVTVFETEFGKMGVCICYDVRFPEMFRLMADKGAKAVFVPGAFNMTTGPAHWELTFRARALDNQMFVLGCEPSRDASSSYVAWGHTILTDPWGRVVKELDEKPGILSAEIDLTEEENVREQLPLLRQRRKDIYCLHEK